jgi:arylsulfatase A-like enzyme
MDVHHPFLPAEKYQREFLDETISRRQSIQLRQKFLNEPEEITDAEHEQFIGLYDAEIRFTDDQIARLLEAANEELADPTIALTADHGEHFLERGYFSSAQLYDIKQHVPLLINGLGEPNSYDQIVSLTDVPSTLVDNAGLVIPDKFHGHSLVDLVKNEVWERESLKGGYGLDDPAFMIRTERWKYIERSDGAELYNLSVDSAEEENVADYHPELVEQFADELERHRDRVKQTETSVAEVDVDQHVKARLSRLGYDE